MPSRFHPPMLMVMLSLLLAGCRENNSTAAQRTVERIALPTAFDRPLHIPPLAESTVNIQGQRVFKLTAQSGTTQLIPGVHTPTFGYNGTYLGPTLRAKRGEQVRVEFHNALNEVTTLHWHGMHLPSSMDGNDHQPVLAGHDWNPTWTINQPAATLWYHPHPHGATERQAYKGLAGLFYLVDEIGENLTLPKKSGVDDIPVIVQDKRFENDGSFRIRDHSELGLLGQTVFVNGTYLPYHQVSTSKIRLRLVNGSTARIYNFGFADDRPFEIIASDGGLLERPYKTNRVQLSPGERSEIVLEMRANTTARLRSFPQDLGTILNFAYGGNDSFDLLELQALSKLQTSSPLPAKLAIVPKLSEAQASIVREFRLEERSINGQKMDMSRIDTTVDLNSTEVWELFNQNGFPHNFHIHDVQFQVLSIGGLEPAPELAGWKDTIYLRPRTAYRLIMRFADYADANVPYMYHCHLLFHEDQGMMGQFVVIDPKATIIDPKPLMPGHLHR